MNSRSGGARGDSLHEQAPTPQQKFFPHGVSRLGTDGDSNAARPGSTEESAPKLGLVAACAFPAPRGSQVLVQEMAAALSCTGAEVHLIAPVDPRARARPYHTHAVTPAVPRARAGGPTGLLRPIVDLSLVGRLLQVVKAQRLDVLHAHNYEGLAASLAVRAACGIPVVYHSHNVFSDELPTYLPRGLQPLARRLGRWCDRTFPRLADQVVTLSADVAGYLVDCGVDAAEISVIPPGLNTAPFQECRRETRRPRVVFTGNLDGYQNLDLLLDAWRLVEAERPEAELVLLTHVQRGRAARRLQRRRLGSRARLGVVHSLEEVARELGEAMVGISPRASWSGFPIKTLNYMACGLPTVALGGSAKGVRPGETGWVVEQETPTALADALVDALASPGECARRGRAARARLEQLHSWENLAPRILEVSRVAAGRDRHPAGSVEASYRFEGDFPPGRRASFTENPLN